MYRIIIERVEDSEVLYEQVVENLDIPEIIMSVLNNSEYGLDIDHECPIHEHLVENEESYYNLGPDDFGGEDYPDYPFGNVVQGFKSRIDN